MKATDFDSIIEAVYSSDNIAIVSHTNPDADAYGSSCGLAWGLKALGKQVAVYNDHGFIPRYRIIPGASDVIKGAWPSLGPNGLLIVVDCGGADRVGDLLLELVQQAPCVINIDHHTSNTLFGHLNHVVDGASSTSELIFDLLSALEERTVAESIITVDVAACLLSGIIGDTGSFRYPSTTARTFFVASELVKRGARPDILTQELFATQSLAALRLQSAALSAVKVHQNGFAEVVVTQEMLKRFGADILDADSLAERARDIEGVRVSALFKEDIGLWRVSLRARQGGPNLSEIAQSFGGGGHRAAAAFRWRRELAVVQEQLREAIDKVL